MIKYQKIFVNILAYISQIILTYQKKPELSKFININKRQSILKIKKLGKMIDSKQ